MVLWVCVCSRGVERGQSAAEKWRWPFWPVLVVCVVFWLGQSARVCGLEGGNQRDCAVIQEVNEDDSVSYHPQGESQIS